MSYALGGAKICGKNRRSAQRRRMGETCGASPHLALSRLHWLAVFGALPGRAHWLKGSENATLYFARGLFLAGLARRDVPYKRSVCPGRALVSMDRKMDMLKA